MSERERKRERKTEVSPKPVSRATIRFADHRIESLNKSSKLDTETSFSPTPGKWLSDNVLRRSLAYNLLYDKDKFYPQFYAPSSSKQPTGQNVSVAAGATEILYEEHRRGQFKSVGVVTDYPGMVVRVGIDEEETAYFTPSGLWEMFRGGHQIDFVRLLVYDTINGRYSVGFNKPYNYSNYFKVEVQNPDTSAHNVLKYMIGQVRYEY